LDGVLATKVWCRILLEKIVVLSYMNDIKEVAAAAAREQERDEANNLQYWYALSGKMMMIPFQDEYTAMGVQ